MLKEVNRLGGASFLTEFGLCAPDGDPLSINTIECNAVLKMADSHLQSWTYWDSGFFDDCGGIHGVKTMHTINACNTLA